MEKKHVVIGVSGGIAAYKASILSANYPKKIMKSKLS